MILPTHLTLSRLRIGDARTGKRVERTFINDGQGNLVEQPQSDSADPNHPTDTALDTLIKLYAISRTFAWNAGANTDIRDCGLMPDLLENVSSIIEHDLPALLNATQQAQKALQRFIELNDPTAKDLRALENLQRALEPFTHSNKT